MTSYRRLEELWQRRVDKCSNNYSPIYIFFNVGSSIFLQKTENNRGNIWHKGDEEFLW